MSIKVKNTTVDRNRSAVPNLVPAGSGNLGHTVIDRQAATANAMRSAAAGFIEVDRAGVDDDSQIHVVRGAVEGPSPVASLGNAIVIYGPPGGERVVTDSQGQIVAYHHSPGA